MALGQVFFEITLEFKQVSAGAKLGAGTRQHQHTHRLVPLQAVERLQKIAAHLRHHAVATLGPVHGQQCDALGNLFKPHRFKRHPITDFCHIRLDQFKIQLKVLTLLDTTRAEVPSSHLPSFTARPTWTLPTVRRSVRALRQVRSDRCAGV